MEQLWGVSGIWPRSILHRLWEDVWYIEEIELNSQ